MHQTCSSFFVIRKLENYFFTFTIHLCRKKSFFLWQQKKCAKNYLQPITSNWENCRARVVSKIEFTSYFAGFFFLKISSVSLVRGGKNHFPMFPRVEKKMMIFLPFDEVVYVCFYNSENRFKNLCTLKIFVTTIMLSEGEASEWASVLQVWFSAEKTLITPEKNPRNFLIPFSGWLFAFHILQFFAFFPQWNSRVGKDRSSFLPTTQKKKSIFSP